MQWSPDPPVLCDRRSSGPDRGRRHLETFGPPEDEGRGRPHRTRNERHEKLMRKMRAEKNKDDVTDKSPE